LIYWWARAAAMMPATANFLTQTPGLSHLAKHVGGYSQKRTIPAFAPETFKEWFAKRGVRNAGKPQVILWPDTFNNHFTPAVARASVEVLEDAGYQVRIPARSLCCGRPLYDYGMLETARGMLHQTLNVLREPIRQGIPVVGLEPSCVSVFRDELGNLLYGDEDAVRLAKQTHLLSEFLHDRGYTPPPLHRHAVVHGHCHHKSELHFDDEVGLLKQAGVDCNVPDSGCCGMAGSFGYEADHYETGLACGERVLLPAVRQASHDTLIVADGFSCREMIHQETSRRALHVAQVIQMALREGPDGARDALPEARYAVVEKTPPLPASVVVAGLVAIAGIWFATRNA
jgi:Fe-S oxidoreductase